MRESACAHEPERAVSGHELCPVDEREPLLRGQLHRLEPGARQRLEPGHPLALEERLTLADERQGEVGERREVAGRADAAARRDDGHETAVETREHELDRLDTRSRVPLGERVRAEKHRRAHDLVRIRLADAARMRAEKSQL